MTRVVGHGLSVSLDGYMAGRYQSRDAPLGLGGERLHEWAFETKCMRRLHGMEGGDEGSDNEWAAMSLAGIGATIMGRNMFGPVRGPWDNPPWTGWWGADPPFHHPVFVLTHYARESEAMEGGTTFHFVTTGIDEALEQAKAAADGMDVRVAGGAGTVRQYLDARLLDELHVAVVPTLLGGGERLLDSGVSDLAEAYEVARAEGTKRALHVLLRRRDT